MPTEAKKSFSLIREAHLGRIKRGLALRAKPSEMKQQFHLAKDFVERFEKRHGAEGQWAKRLRADLKPLAEAIAEAETSRAAPPLHLTTVGDLKALLAGLPDSTPLRDIPCVDPEWTTQVARVLSLIPPVQRAKPAPGRSFDNLWGTKSASELIDG